MPILDGDFPISIPVIPTKDVPGSAKARVSPRLRTLDGIELLAEAVARNLQQMLEAS